MERYTKIIINHLSFSLCLWPSLALYSWLIGELKTNTSKYMGHIFNVTIAKIEFDFNIVAYCAGY